MTTEKIREYHSLYYNRKYRMYLTPDNVNPEETMSIDIQNDYTEFE